MGFALAYVLRANLVFERLLEIAARTLELAHRPSELPPDLRQAPRPEDDERDNEDDDQFRHADGAEHLRLRLPGHVADELSAGPGCLQQEHERQDAQERAEIGARRQQLAHLRSPALIEGAKTALERLRQDKAELDRSMQDIIESDAELQAKATLLKGTPGAGPVLLATLLAELPELGQLDRRQIASLAGLAPVARDSGLMRGRRVIHGGRKEVRGALYMAVLALSRRDSRFARAYRALVEKGKPKKLALVATMRKLLVTLNAIARHNTPWREHTQQTLKNAA